MTPKPMKKEPTAEELRMARTLQAQRREGISPPIAEMARTLIDVYGYESGRRIARSTAGDNNYWSRVALVIDEEIAK